MEQKKIPVLALLLLSLLLFNCSSTSDLEKFIKSRGIMDPIIEQNGFLTTIKIENGNLLDSAVFSREERAALLADFISKNGPHFKMIEGNELSFNADTSEIYFDLNAIPYLTVNLYQSFKGIRILENLQKGIFNELTGELKVIETRFHDLPDIARIPIPTKTDINAQWQKFLETNPIPEPQFQISPEKYISIREKVCGYKLDVHSKISEREILLMSLLINPETNQTVVISKSQIDL